MGASQVQLLDALLYQQSFGKTATNSLEACQAESYSGAFYRSSGSAL